MTEKMMPQDAAKRISGIGYIALSSPNYAGFPVGDYVVNYTSRQGAQGQGCWPGAVQGFWGRCTAEVKGMR
jgi:hypothetical protein